MEPLTEIDFRNKVEPVYRLVFDNGNPYNAPFKPEINPRLLLFSFQWMLVEPWLSPVIQAIIALGESGFYVSALSRPVPEKQTQPYHWYVPLSEASRYGSVIVSQANAIYSVNGQWGIICSDEDHALVGGPELLITNIRNAVHDLDTRVNEFLKMWDYYHRLNGANISWLPGMLSHVFGVNEANRLLRLAKLAWLFQAKG